MSTNKLSFDYTNAARFFHQRELDNLEPEIRLSHERLHRGLGPGSDYLGWVDLPAAYDRDELKRLQDAAKRIRNDSDILIVIGIGGSYLGSRAAIDFSSHSFYNMLSTDQRSGPQVLYAGHNVSGAYLQDLLELIADRDVSLNVISKSGTTTEPALVFRVLRRYMETRYGANQAAQRIYATTDARTGAMRAMADRMGYESFTIPDNVGGRFSVLTPVGLLPIAAAGIDIEAMLAGAQEARDRYLTPDLEANEAYQYAAIRNVLYRKGRIIEVMANYEPSLHMFIEWWKQLFGESEGKDQKGIFPAGVDLTTDLHSMGQLLQDGMRNLFETVLLTADTGRDVVIQKDQENLDGLNYLSGISLNHVNRQAFFGTLLAHTDGGVPNLVVEIPQLTPFYFGWASYFFQKACGISGYLLGVNPFDQPGVEDYKRNMFALLGHPKFREHRSQLEERLRREAE